MGGDFIAEQSPIPFFFRIVYLSNKYRDPLIRQFEHELNLTRPEFSILVCLGQQTDLSAIDIAIITSQPQNSVSRGVWLLGEKGLIVKHPDAQDKRKYLLRLTKEGKAFYKKIIAELSDVNDKMIACLNAREKDRLETLLKKMCLAAEIQ